MRGFVVGRTRRQTNKQRERKKTINITRKKRCLGLPLAALRTQNKIHGFTRIKDWKDALIAALPPMYIHARTQNSSIVVGIVGKLLFILSPERKKKKNGRAPRISCRETTRVGRKCEIFRIGLFSYCSTNTTRLSLDFSNKMSYVYSISIVRSCLKRQNFLPALCCCCCAGVKLLSTKFWGVVARYGRRHTTLWL